jgi:hypothetical protein
MFSYPEISTNMLLMNAVFLFLIGVCTAYYAQQKGRSPFLWFLLGFGFGIFAPLVLFFISYFTNKSKTEEPTMTVSLPDPVLENKVSPSEIETHTQTAVELQPDENKLWYYLDAQHQQMGPVSIIALREMWQVGTLNLKSYTWSEGMNEWKRVDELPELKALLNRA